jgi:hypothetical protein
MTKRICWKKGMRLTDQLLRASENSSEEFIGKAFVLAVAGRFGLFPSSHPFELSLNITKGMVDVESFSCLAMTRGGQLIDVNYDTRYTGSFDTRVQIPDNRGEKEFFLTINAHPGEWREANDGYEEPVYSFSLISPNSPIPDYSMPIGHLVDDYGWRVDDIYFVPPCLFVSSHPKYEELLKQFLEVLKVIDLKAQKYINSSGKIAIRVFWPIVQQLLITTDKEHDLMTPMMLLSEVQKCVSAFACACELDENLNLADADVYRNYVMAPYNYKNAYQRIKEGLDICISISEKVDKFQMEVEEVKVMKMAAPSIANDQLFQNCKNQSVYVAVQSPDPNAEVFYSIDGSEPSKRLMKNGTVPLEGGFSKTKVPEPDKTVTIKLKAVFDGSESEIGVYTVTLHKDFKDWNGFQI